MSPVKKPAKKAARKVAKAVKKVATKAKAAAKKAVARGAKAVRKRPPSEKDTLVASLAKSLGLSAADVELRALRELAARSGQTAAQAASEERASLQTATFGSVPAAQPSQTPVSSALPKRLYLLLDGRGLDGHGLPVEVIQSPTTLGSGKFCTIWVNAPQIETRHLEIKEEPEGWVMKDLGSAKGTFLGDERVQRRLIQHGDEYRLAGYLRLRTELR